MGKAAERPANAGGVAIAKATVTCPICDRRHVIVNYFHRREDAEKWRSWAESNFHYCPACDDERQHGRRGY